jgi:hypothetical protein
MEPGEPGHGGKLAFGRAAAPPPSPMRCATPNPARTRPRAPIKASAAPKSAPIRQLFAPRNSRPKKEKLSQSHNQLYSNYLRLLFLPKKCVVKPAVFSYFHYQLHRMVPGQTVVCLEARKARNKKNITNNKQNNIGGTR